MAGINMNGLASGLDTKAIIDALMAVAEIPKTQLQNKVTDRQYVISQLQSLNSSVKSVGETAKKLAGFGALDKTTAASSSQAVTVTGKAGAQPMNASIVVDKVATTHTVVSAAMSSFSGSALTIKAADGTLTEVTPASSSLTDVAKAINESGAGVKAAVVSAGGGQFRLQVTAKDTGADASFTIYEGTEADVLANTATDLASGGAVVTQGSDAEVRLWAGTAAEQVVNSKTNTFEDLFPGVDVKVSVVSAEPVNVSVATDTAAQSKVVEDFTKQVQAILSGIKNGSKATVGDAGTAATLGVFTGDATVRALSNDLKNAVTLPVDGVSPSSIGMTMDKYGVLSFDKEKFAAAMAKDPEGTEKVFNAIAARVEGVSDTYSDSYDGVLTKRVQNQEAFVRQLNTQIEQMDKRLEMRRDAMVLKYAALETAMQQMNSQKDYLTAQFAAMTKKSDD